MKIKLIYLLLVLVVTFTTTGYSKGTEVIKHQDQSERLETKWHWAMQQVDQFSDGVWIGYSIKRMMPKNAYTGIYLSGDEKFNYPTIEQIIYQRNINNLESESLSEAARNALTEFDKKHTKSDVNQLVEKEMAILFFFDHNMQLQKIRVSNISLYADLNNKSIIWLGVNSQKVSASLLIDLYTKIHKDNTKEELMIALSIHKDSELPIPFYSSIIKSDEENQIREKAVFWLGNHNHDKSIDLLHNTALNDHSRNVREKAVFAIYLMDSKRADESLIQLATSASEKEIKKKAIFWLGQKAADKTVEVLEEIVENEDDLELKEQAVFALSQLDNNEGIPQLIEIAQNHSNKEIRKKAIFWLGQSEDPRALDTIISIVQKHN